MIIHYTPAWCLNPFDDKPMCGSVEWDELTDEPSYVTCPECLKRLADLNQNTPT